MAVHIIENGIVVNTILATVDEAKQAYPNAMCVDTTLGGKIGDSWDGEVFTPAPPAPEPVPASCTRRQGLLALLSYGIKRSEIETQIETIEDEMEREAAWIEYLADIWELGNPRLQAMWAALGGTPEQLDDLFRMAVAL